MYLDFRFQVLERGNLDGMLKFFGSLSKSPPKGYRVVKT